MAAPDEFKQPLPLSSAVDEEAPAASGDDLSENTERRIRRRRSQKGSLMAAPDGSIPLAMLTPPTKYEGLSYAGWVKAVCKPKRNGG